MMRTSALSPFPWRIKLLCGRDFSTHVAVSLSSGPRLGEIYLCIKLGGGVVGFGASPGRREPVRGFGGRN
jgi:hypothetical protein